MLDGGGGTGQSPLTPWLLSLLWPCSVVKTCSCQAVALPLCETLQRLFLTPSACAWLCLCLTLPIPLHAVSLYPWQPMISFSPEQGAKASCTERDGCMRVILTVGLGVLISLSAVRQFTWSLSRMRNPVGDDDEGCNAQLCSLIQTNRPYEYLSLLAADNQCRCTSLAKWARVFSGHRP